MTDLEKECLSVLLRVRDAWTRRFISKEAFMDLMSAVVQAIKHLESKSYSCPTGVHVGSCDCKPAVVGRSKEWKYFHKEKINTRSQS